MSEAAQDILANAVVVGPNVLPLDPSAAPAVPAVPVADEGDSEAAAPAEAPPPPQEGDEGEEQDGEDDTESDGEEPQETPPPQARRKRSFDARFSDLTHERNLARQEAEYWRRRALDGGQPPQNGADQPGQPAQQPAGIPRYPSGEPIPPQEEGFANHDDFVRAQSLYNSANIQWHVSQALAQERLRTQEEQALRQMRENHSDYDEVVRNTPVRLNNDVSQAVLASAHKHQLIYRLATHPDEAMALENLNGLAAYLAIGRLESLVSTETPAPEPAPAHPPAPATSNAPPPIQPTRGNGAVAVRDYDQMSLQEFFEARNKEERRRRG